jgi:hypothetical protein
MPGLVPGIHVLLLKSCEGVDGRDTPGHDEEMCIPPWRYLMASGFVGDPTAPVIGIAGATNMNS